MQVLVDSLLTRYESKGRGRVVLLLHGWGDTAQGLRVLQDELAKKYTVLAVDLPGFGGTAPPLTPWGLDDYAQFIAHFLKKISVKSVYALVGHSNGGAIAIRGIGKGTLSADKVVLIAAAGIRGTYKGRVKALRVITKIGKALTSPLPKSVKSKLRQGVYQSVGSDMLVAEHLQETFKKVITDDVRADASQLTQPTLLLYGELDESAPAWYGQAYHELMPNSTLEILAGGGHFLQIDHPEWVKKLIMEFLA